MFFGANEKFKMAAISRHSFNIGPYGENEIKNFSETSYQHDWDNNTKDHQRKERTRYFSFLFSLKNIVGKYLGVIRFESKVGQEIPVVGSPTGISQEIPSWTILQKLTKVGIIGKYREIQVQCEILIVQMVKISEVSQKRA